MDALWIDRAYIRWKLPEVGGLQSALVAGKTANPFVWKYGKDAVMFDGDITPEGGALLLAYPIDEHSRLFGNFGVYIIDENSSSADPKLTAAQLGGQTEVGGFDMGLRGSMYWYRSLDSDYITASEEFGNLPTAYDGGKSRLGEISAFIGTELHEDWPALAYGSFTKNFDAESGFCTVYEDAAGDLQPIDCSGAAFVPPAGSTVLGASSASDQDEAWSAGVEVGSLKKILKVGFAYFYVEANAVSSIFTDSDILDGYTNREGWVIYGGRQLTTNTEFRFAFYKSTYIENGGAFVLSTDASKRSRLQTDVIFKF